MSAEISPSCRTSDAVYVFSRTNIYLKQQNQAAVKRLRESVRWADLTIRFVVKANSLSARRQRKA